MQRERNPHSETVLTQIGLVAAALLAILLAVSIPSVIKLWYTIGTTIVPGLLIPLVAGYFDRLRVGPRFAFGAMLGGWLVSASWLAAGWSREIAASAAYPLGIEPIYPGLTVSAAIWILGQCRKARSTRQIRRA
jgi:hypothetical protein